MNAVVQAENLSRFYGLILGLNNISFTITPGITGVVGPNGAGKTTLFRLLTGQIKPSSGRIEVFGASPWNNPAVQARLGYCPETEAVPPGLRPLDWLVALGMISGLARRPAEVQARAALERVKLEPAHWGKKLTELSKGMRQRVKLAQCLLHEPALIILDEPMNGLDPMGREDIARVLRQLALDGVTIIISSHIIHDLEALCGRFLLLSGGRLPRSTNAAAAPEARSNWPEATSFRCDEPDRLARFFFDRDLIRGCELRPERGELHVRWRDPDAFYSDFHRLLLESGVAIFEVRSTTSFLEKAIEPMLRP